MQHASKLCDLQVLWGGSEHSLDPKESKIWESLVYTKVCASDLFVTQYTSNISYLGLYPPDQRHVWHSLVYLEWFGMIKAQAIGLLQYVHHSVVGAVLRRRCGCGGEGRGKCFENKYTIYCLSSRPRLLQKWKEGRERNRVHTCVQSWLTIKKRQH